jgi:hypothetical protein
MSRDADRLNAKCSLGSWSPRPGFVNVHDPKRRASWALERARKQYESEPMSFVSSYSLMRQRHGLWKGVST